MIGIGPGARVMVATRPVDFRKGPDALAAPDADQVGSWASREQCRRTHAVDRSGLNRFPALNPYDRSAAVATTHTRLV